MVGETYGIAAVDLCGITPGRHNEVVATVLIELPGGEGIIRREDGEIALTHDVTLDEGQPLQPWDRYQPISLSLSDDRMLFGGLLPPGAVSAEAVQATGERTPAATGDGAYAVILEDGKHGEPALGYRDAAGAFVHRPMPAEYPHEPITDAEEPCRSAGRSNTSSTSSLSSGVLDGAGKAPTASKLTRSSSVGSAGTRSTAGGLSASDGPTGRMRMTRAERRDWLVCALSRRCSAGTQTR
jgi:hypothetical protein